MLNVFCLLYVIYCLSSSRTLHNKIDWSSSQSARITVSAAGIVVLLYAALIIKVQDITYNLVSVIYMQQYDLGGL